MPALVAGQVAGGHVVQGLEVALEDLVVSGGRPKRHLPAGVVVAAGAVLMAQLARSDLRGQPVVPFRVALDCELERAAG